MVACEPLSNISRTAPSVLQEGWKCEYSPVCGHLGTLG
jgi:hypothetical protein